MHFMHFLVRVSQISRIPDSELGWEDMYQDDEGSGWFDWVSPSLLIILCLAAGLNAVPSVDRPSNNPTRIWISWKRLLPIHSYASISTRSCHRPSLIAKREVRASRTNTGTSAQAQYVHAHHTASVARFRHLRPFPIELESAQKSGDERKAWWRGSADVGGLDTRGSGDDAVFCVFSRARVVVDGADERELDSYVPHYGACGRTGELDLVLMILQGMD